MVCSKIAGLPKKITTLCILDGISLTGDHMTCGEGNWKLDLFNLFVQRNCGRNLDFFNICFSWHMRNMFWVTILYMNHVELHALISRILQNVRRLEYSIYQGYNSYVQKFNYFVGVIQFDGNSSLILLLLKKIIELKPRENYILFIISFCKNCFKEKFQKLCAFVIFLFKFD